MGKKYRHIPWNRYNFEKYREIHFWSYRPALQETFAGVLSWLADWHVTKFYFVEAVIKAKGAPTKYLVHIQ